MASGGERATSERTLVCLLQAVQGHRTIVELRNESSAAGLIDNVDGFMNISMSDVKFSKQNGQAIKKLWTFQQCLYRASKFVTFKFPILLTCGRLLKNS